MTDTRLKLCPLCKGKMDWCENPAGVASRCSSCKMIFVGYWSDSANSYLSRFNARPAPEAGWRDMDSAPKCEQCQEPATKLCQMTTHQCEPMPICEDCAATHDAISSEINDHEMRHFGGAYGQVTYHYLPLPPTPGEPATEQQSVKEAARLTPDQLLEQIADRLENSDPDVAPWAVKWADDISAAISRADPNPKSIAAALRSLAGDK